MTPQENWLKSILAYPPQRLDPLEGMLADLAIWDRASNTIESIGRSMMSNALVWQANGRNLGAHLRFSTRI